MGATPLDPVRLDAKALGTCGTLYGTLQHLVGAEQWYAKLLTGETVGHPIRPRALACSRLPRPKTRRGSSSPRARAFHRRRRPRTGGPSRHEHRTQATTILGANGIEPPALSAWAYGSGMRVSTTEE